MLFCCFGIVVFHVLKAPQIFLGGFEYYLSPNGVGLAGDELSKVAHEERVQE